MAAAAVTFRLVSKTDIVMGEAAYASAYPACFYLLIGY